MNVPFLWRGGREAEGAGLLNQYTAQSCIEGSNPSLSATPPATDGPIAQLDRASDYESEARRFESCWARHLYQAAWVWAAFSASNRSSCSKGLRSMCSMPRSSLV